MTKAIFRGPKGKNKFRGLSLVDVALVTWQRDGDVTATTSFLAERTLCLFPSDRNLSLEWN